MKLKLQDGDLVIPSVLMEDVSMRLVHLPEAFLLVLIYNDAKASPDGYCHLTNTVLSNRLSFSPSHISNLIQGLARRGYLACGYKRIGGRHIYSPWMEERGY